MTDYKRLGATLNTLGTMLEHDGARVDSTLSGWATGPQTPEAPPDGARDEEEVIVDPTRKDDQKHQARAAELHQEYLDAVRKLERQAEVVLRILAVAIPVHPAALRNVRTGDLDPITAADAAAAGWCMSCWRNEQQMVIIETKKSTGLRYYRDYCRWCGAFKAEHKIEPPLEILRLHHDGRRISESDVADAVKAALSQLAAQTSKRSKKARRKGQVAA